MSSSFKYLDKAQVGSQPNKAQSFLDEKLAKNKYTIKQEDTGSKFDPSRYTPGQLDELEANGGSAQDFGSQYNRIISNQDAISKWDATDASGGGTERYADYGNTNKGQTAFTDAWQDGAKYQQLKGTTSQTNDAFNEQFAAAKGGAETGTIADDGGGWKLIDQRDNTPVGVHKDDYRRIAQEWQAAGYDVRVQDHIHDASQAEIAVRVSKNKGERPKEQEELEKIEHSPEIQQAKERVRTYENDVLSGKVSDDVYAGNTSDKYNLDLNKGADGIGAFIPNTSEQATASFLDNKKSQIKDKYQFNRA
jgi:hypothetical protein